MSAHCRSSWTLNDPIEDAPIKGIAGVVEFHGYSTPGVFGIFSVADGFIFNIGHFLSGNRGKPLTRELIEADIPPEAEFRDKTIEVVVKVLEELKLLGETQPVPERRGFKLPDKISIPKVNRPYPKL